MRGRKWSWSEKILFLTPFLFVLMAFWTFFTPRDRIYRPDVRERTGFLNFLRSHESYHGPICLSNLKQIGLGLVQYAQDYDEKFPPVASGGITYGWVETIDPYIKSRQLFRCPSSPTKPTASPRRSGYTSYYLNQRLGGQNWQPSNGNRLILMGEGDDGTDLSDARYSKSSLPAKWEKDLKSPLFRHLSEEVWATRGSYFAFADGHVKFLSPKEIENGDSASSSYTLMLRGGVMVGCLTREALWFWSEFGSRLAPRESEFTLKAPFLSPYHNPTA